MQIRIGASVRLSLIGLLWVLLSTLPRMADAAVAGLFVVGVWEGRVQHVELSQVLVRAARMQQGMRVELASDAAGTASGCVKYDCLAPLARRKGLALVLGGQLQPLRVADEAQQTLRLFLFDAAQNGSTPQVLHGTVDELEKAIPAAVETLLRNRAEPMSPPPPPALVRDTADSTRHRDRLGPGRIGLAAGLGILATLSLAGGIVAQALNDQPAWGRVCDDAPALMRAHDTTCLYQTVPLAISGYSIAAASLVGLTLALVVP